MKKFSIYILALALPIPIIIGVNLALDSDGLINESYLDEFVEELDKNDIAISGPIPERRIVKKRIRNKTGEHFNKIVIGSSRTLLFGIPINQNVFNASVAGGGYGDYVEIIRLIEEHNITYDTIVLCGDPWLLDKNYTMPDYLEFETPVLGKLIKSMISWKYFITNLTPGKYNSWDGNEMDFIRYKDGSIRNHISTRTEKTSAKKLINADIIGVMRSFSNIDSTHLHEFINFLNKISGNTLVELLLLPYHPLTYNSIINESRFIEEIEQIFYSFSGNNIKVFGSFNPTNIDFKEEDFYDAVHLTENGLTKFYSLIKD